MAENLTELQKQKEDIEILLSTLEEAFRDASITEEHYKEVKGKNEKKLKELEQRIGKLEKAREAPPEEEEPPAEEAREPEKKPPKKRGRPKKSGKPAPGKKSPLPETRAPSGLTRLVAAAAATVLTRDGHSGRIYELAGDKAYTMTELAAEITRQANKTVKYKDLTEEDYKAALIDGGIPEEFAAMLAESDVWISKGALFDYSCQLSQLIGRPTTPLSTTITAAIKEFE